uniref:Secreted protein n=1 Tax=Panagrellus redivivus TaxID=6233 RepID=A0A7E5A217_PANRE
MSLRVLAIAFTIIVASVVVSQLLPVAHCRSRQAASQPRFSFSVLLRLVFTLLLLPHPNHPPPSKEDTISIPSIISTNESTPEAASRAASSHPNLPAAPSQRYSFPIAAAAATYEVITNQTDEKLCSICIRRERNACFVRI